MQPWKKLSESASLLVRDCCLRFSSLKLNMRDLLQANIDLDWQGWFVIATLACAFLIMAADKVIAISAMQRFRLTHLTRLAFSPSLTLDSLSQAGPDLVFTILLAIYVTAGIVPGELDQPRRCYDNLTMLSVQLRPRPLATPIRVFSPSSSCILWLRASIRQVS